MAAKDRMKKNPSENPLLKEAVDNASIMASSIWISRIVIFFSSVFVVRILGAELYGVYIIGRKLFNIVLILAVFGLDAAMVKFVSTYRETGEKDKYQASIASVLIWGMGFSAAAAALLIILSHPLGTVFHMPQLPHVLIIFAAGLPFAAFLRFISGFFRGVKKLKYQALTGNLVLPSVRLAVLAGLFFLGLRLDAVLFSALLSFIAAASLAAYIFSSRFDHNLFSLIKKATRNAARKILRFSSTLFGIQFLSELSLRVDIYMVSFFLAADQVGIYGVVIEISLMFRIILSAFSQIFSPQISGAWARGDIPAIAELYKFVSKLIFLLVIPIFMFIVLYPENILAIFGPAFLSGKTALLIMCFGQVINCTVGGAGFILTMTGKQRFQLYNTLAGLVVNTALNFFLIPEYGIVGAALATTTSLVFINVLCILQVKVFYGFDFFKRTFIKPLAAALLTSLAFHLVVPDFSSLVFLLASGILFLGVYIGLLFLFGFDEEEAFILNSYLKRLKERRRKKQ